MHMVYKVLPVHHAYWNRIPDALSNERHEDVSLVPDSVIKSLC